MIKCKVEQNDWKNIMPVYLNALGIACALGESKQSIANALFLLDVSDRGDSLVESDQYIQHRAVIVGALPFELPSLGAGFSRFDCRNNRLLFHVLNEIRDDIAAVISNYGNKRIGIVLGSSTSGIAEGGDALAAFKREDAVPETFHYAQQEIGGPSEFLAEYLNLRGPALTISTACSSSAKVFASGRRLIESGQCDAVIVGGVDTLCKLTLNGFSSLSAVSSGYCNPFSKNRDGINIGEGAALFLMSGSPADIALYGVGEASDAYHISGPHPEGIGAATAMNAAIHQANISPSDIDYVNLHGTATAQNDAMESIAVFNVLGNKTPVSSTKGMVGHTLGAAGAIEVGFCYLTLSSMNKNKTLPLQVWDGEPDDNTQQLRFVQKGDALNRKKSRHYCLSNSFAFGGSNVSVVIGSVG